MSTLVLGLGLHLLLGAVAWFLRPSQAALQEANGRLQIEILRQQLLVEDLLTRLQMERIDWSVDELQALLDRD